MWITRPRKSACFAWATLSAFLVLVQSCCRREHRPLALVAKHDKCRLDLQRSNYFLHQQSAPERLLCSGVSMLSWRLCCHHTLKQGQSRASALGTETAALAWQGLRSPCVGARELHNLTSRETRPQGFARLLVAAASRSKRGSGGKGKEKRDFHGTPPAEYKSGPGTAKWRYDNVLSKPAPKPVSHLLQIPPFTPLGEASLHSDVQLWNIFLHHAMQRFVGCSEHH